MTVKKNRSAEDKLGRAFREGVKRSYGKIFWRWLDERRGDLSTNAYCLKVLNIFPSTYSLGKSAGAFCLENMINVLVSVGASLREAPEFPDKRVMRIMGFQRAMSVQREESIYDISIIPLCYALELSLGTRSETQLWHQYQENLRRSADRASREAWRKTIRDMEHKIATHVVGLIELYYQTYPGERPKTQTNHNRDCSLVWESYGNDLQTCLNALGNVSWIELDG